MDLSMPRMNGLEAARQVKQTLPHVPIILFTLHKNAVRQADASKSGVSAVISKVDEPDLLVSEIASLLNQSGRAGA
jgi:CheY-like chemotaxis protein